MPSNERENQRIEKQRQKDKKTRTVIWTFLIVFAFVLVIMKVCEIDFADIKNRIDFNNTSSAIVNEKYPVSIDSLGFADVCVANDKIDVLTDVQFKSIEPSSGKEIYSFDHGYSNPRIVSQGSYTCVYDQGGTRIRLDSTSDMLYEKSLDKSIISASIARNGTIAYTTFTDGAKSKIVVINKNESKKYEYDIMDGYVVNLALNSNGTKLAYTTVNSKNAFLQSTVHIMVVGSDEEASAFDYADTNILELRYTDADNIYVIGDNSLSLIKSYKKQAEIFKKGSIQTKNYCFTTSGELVLNYSEYSNASKCTIVYVKSNGKIRSTISTKKTPKFISSNSNEITVLFQNKAVVYSLNKGEKKKLIPCDNSVNSIYTLSSKSYVQYGQYIDVID